MTTFTMYERAGIGFNMDPNSAEGVDLTQSSEMVIDEVLSDDGSTLVVSVSNAGDVAFLGVNYYMSGDYVLIEDFLYFDFEAELLLLIDDVNLEFSAADMAAGIGVEGNAARADGEAPWLGVVRVGGEDTGPRDRQSPVEPRLAPNAPQRIGRTLAGVERAIVPGAPDQAARRDQGHAGETAFQRLTPGCAHPVAAPKSTK